MSAALAIAPESMLPEAASISLHYPQFQAVDVPAGSSALAAWEGTIQPFLSDALAIAFLETVERDLPFNISEGTMLCKEQAKFAPAHPLARFMVDMTRECKLLILSFAAPIHPRAYLLLPEFSSVFLSNHPHTRGDLAITFRKRKLPALCLYSAAEFKFKSEVERIVEFMDQASVYVARHLIWLRTRKLYRATVLGPQLIHSPKPGELIVDNEVGVHNAAAASIVLPERCFWQGYWPGKEANGLPSHHLRTVKPRSQCWCGSGQSYGDCHRPREMKRSA
jgi:hypothetical protein